MFGTLPGGGSPGGEHTGRSRGRTTTAHQTGLLTEISLLPAPVQTRHHFPGSPFTAKMHRLPGAAERGPQEHPGSGRAWGGASLAHRFSLPSSNWVGQQLPPSPEWK